MSLASRVLFCTNQSNPPGICARKRIKVQDVRKKPPLPFFFFFKADFLGVIWSIALLMSWQAVTFDVRLALKDFTTLRYRNPPHFIPLLFSGLARHTSQAHSSLKDLISDLHLSTLFPAYQGVFRQTLHIYSAIEDLVHHLYWDSKGLIPLWMKSTWWRLVRDFFFKILPESVSQYLSESLAMIRLVTLVCAVAWIAYRIWQVNQISREELEEKLGLDIPSVPDVSIGGIKSDSVLLYWLNSKESHFSSVQHSIQVNGIRVGEFGRGDASIEVTGLKPGNCYNIRVLATNNAGNTTLGPIIRVQTGCKQSSGHSGPSVSGSITYNNQNDGDEPASIRTTSSSFESADTHPGIFKETSGNQLYPSRAVAGRRNSPTSQTAGQTANQWTSMGNSDEDESPLNIQRLTESLESLKRQKADLDKQIEEEDVETKSNIAELTRERDRLKQVCKEKEEASAELRRHGNHLDKLNRTAQSRKAAKEKQLHQRKAERRKVKDEIARWEKDTVEMNNDVDEMRNEKTHVIAEKDQFIAEVRKTIADDQVAIRALEEDIRVKGAQIKALEQKREKMSIEGDEEQERARLEMERDEAWEARYQAMQAQLASGWQAVSQAKMEEQQAQEHLNWWLAKLARNPEQFAPIPALEFPSSMQRNKSRRSRQSSSRTNTLPSPGYQGGSSSFGNDSAISPPFPSASPFFNMSNGSAFSPGPEQTSMLQADVEMLTGGAAMSPAATELLPSNLFRDEDIANSQSTAGRESTGNAILDPFLKHTVSTSNGSNFGPHTPASPSSRAGSIFSSPQDSVQNLHGFQSRPEAFDDNDQQSVRSTGASLRPSLAVEANPLATSRLASLFTSPFGRQRGKSNSQEPPLLGTLKQGQSQSFPRNLEQDALGSASSRRRRGSYGNWANPMAGLLARTSANPGENGLITARTSSGRKSRLTMFGSKFETLEAPGLADQAPPSRPSSTYSHDQIHTRPSSDSQRLWWPTADNLPNRSSPLGANWASNSGPWSRVPSRRASIQHGSTTNLSIGSTPLDLEEYSGPLAKQKSEQAPIGTRPQSAQRPLTPRLNPTAPTFKTLFSRGEARKATKLDKAGNKTVEKFKDREIERAEIDESESAYDASPPNPRLSRDAQSITTATSTADSHDSFDRSTSGTPSEAVISSGPKESLMQKITRKSSSSKFNVPWSKDRGLFSKRAGEPSTPGEIDEDNSSEGQLGRSLDSAGSTPQQEKSGRASISWPNIRRKSKKGDTADKGSEVGEGCE